MRPSREIEDQVSAGRLGALALHRAAALTGGVPLRVGDEVVGAVGTSGETPHEDEAVSRAGAATTITTTPAPESPAHAQEFSTASAPILADVGCPPPARVTTFAALRFATA